MTSLLNSGDTLWYLATPFKNSQSQNTSWMLLLLGKALARESFNNHMTPTPQNVFEGKKDTISLLL